MKVTKKKLDAYYKQALAVADQSHDSETKVGALLIHGRTGAVISSGFNGFVRGADDTKLPNTRLDKYPYMVHAETNLVTNCARHGISTEGCFLFCTLSPCINCMRLLYQAGISMVFFKDVYRDFNKNINMKDMHIKVSEIEDYYAAALEPRGVPKNEDLEDK